jgi:uncharacterized membrane protein (UPF0182 family)
MSDPRQFYYKEDLWQFSTEKFQAQNGETAGEQPVEPYYVILQMPNSDKEEFMLMLPFTPYGKKNMIAWMAAKCDLAEDGTMGDYGHLLVYNFPKGELVDGPIQIEAYIDQKEEISEKLSLWSQRGSSVIRGNLLAIPVKESMLYIEPIYVQAESSAIPQLKRVAVAQGGRLEWGESLEIALTRLYGAPSLALTGDDSEGTPSQPVITDGTIQQLARQAMEQYDRAQQSLRAGEWARYGEEMEKLRETLELLEAK